MISRTEGYFKGFNDFELYYQSWIPEKVASTLVLTHGLGEHSECYSRLVEGLAGLPIEIIIWDLRGHGRSEGKRGVVNNFSDYCEDLICLLNHVKTIKKGTKTFLLGHSMGGLVNSLSIIKKGNMGLDGLCFSSPLMGVTVDIPAIKKKAATHLAKWLPQMTLWNEIPNKDLTHDKDVLAEFDRDPLRHDRISSQLFLDILNYTDYVRKNAHKIELPMILQQATLDKVVSAPMSRKFFDSVGSTDKTWIEYKNSFHEIFNDIERKQVFSDLSKWLSERK